MRLQTARTLFASAACAVGVAGSALIVPASATAEEVEPVVVAAEPASPSERWIVRIDPEADTAVSPEAGDVVAAASATASSIELLPGVWAVDPDLGAALAVLPGVDAHPEAEFRSTVTPNDPCYAGCFPFGDQWHHQAINSAQAWDLATGTGTFTIAVLDSGINDNHVDLSGVVQRSPGCGLPIGTAGSLNHGTFVAALATANTNNSFGVSGVAWNANILDVRVLTGGSGSESDVIAGVVCAADLGVDVINLSVVQCSPFSNPCEPAPSQAFLDAINYARERGSAVVASAGNGGSTTAQYPAAYDGVIGVVATNEAGSIASFSDRGTWADIAAPGDDIVSLSGGSSTGITSGNGTSYAAPLVSGAAALVAQRFPFMSSDQIVRRLLWTSHGYSGTVGSEFGELDLARALTETLQSEWLVTDTGDVIALGDAPHLGDLSGTALNQPIVGMAVTPSGGGYWLVASDGGIFSFGDAAYLGSTGNIALNQPIVGMAVTPSGDGYWLVASDGGIFSFGDAAYLGSTGNIALNQPIVGMATTSSGDGYWLVASDGGIFTFGDAPYLGSTGNIVLNQPIIGMVSGPTGYHLAASDGGMFGFNAAYLGSGANKPHSGAVVGAAGFHQ